MVGFEAVPPALQSTQKRSCVTGTPVRGDFFDLTKGAGQGEAGRERRPAAASSPSGEAWARQLYERLHGGVLCRWRPRPRTVPSHIHAHGQFPAGPAWWSPCRPYGRGAATEHPALDVREYIYDMAAAMRAADLVICRAGASTISELTALGVPALIVPSPYVTNNHQEKNARALGASRRGPGAAGKRDSSGKELYLARPVRLNCAETAAPADGRGNGRPGHPQRHGADLPARCSPISR
jgi:UDP-N-acetylglucosamine--N-acetylmuramyl-(pentapeptide) pyrophosphoryl-undecaprenol N-acetylglucosamine transferase